MSSTIVFPRLAASACVWRDEQVLIVQRGKPPLVGVWSLPGGHVEPGESTRQAAERELHEETGVIAELSALADVVDIIRHDADGHLTVHFAIVCHTGRWITGEASARSDVLAVRWVGTDELSGIDMTEGTADIIRRARDLVTG